MKEFFTRTISGVVFVSLMLGLIWYSEYTLFPLLIFLLIAGISEFYKLILKIGYSPHRLTGIVISILILSLVFLSASGLISDRFLVVAAVIPFLITFLIPLYHKSTLSDSYFSTLTGILYLALPLSAIILISFFTGEYDSRLIFGYFIILWTYDSFAYISGVLLGRHKIMPSVSPKKTWEGAIGGLLFALLVAYLMPALFEILNQYQWMIVSLIIVVTGTIGDFAESWLKRRAGVKDSGKIIPGHGGILDRFDSVLFSIPFVYIYVEFII